MWRRMFLPRNVASVAFLFVAFPFLVSLFSRIHNASAVHLVCSGLDAETRNLE